MHKRAQSSLTEENYYSSADSGFRPLKVAGKPFRESDLDTPNLQPSHRRKTVNVRSSVGANDSITDTINDEFEPIYKFSPRKQAVDMGSVTEFNANSAISVSDFNSRE